jgi:CheY-like chemotaxis protein
VPIETRAALHGKVLLVEDNAVNQLVTRKLCERLGLEVELVEDGSLAVARVERGGFSLVLMDCQMPVMDGYEATRRIRALPGEAARVPIIALTASALPVDLERCKAAGMNDVLLKPIDAALLLEVLLRHLPTALHT